MKNLSIGEFKNLCNKLSPQEFIVSTDNQMVDSTEYGMKCSFIFSTMTISSNPSAIYLKGENTSYLKLERIKYIRKHTDSLLGKTFDIVCTGFIDELKEHSYTIIVR